MSDITASRPEVVNGHGRTLSAQPVSATFWLYEKYTAAIRPTLIRQLAEISAMTESNWR